VVSCKTRRRQNDVTDLGLVVNAVVLWNTRYIDAPVARLRADGHPVRDEDVAGLSRWGTPTSTCSAAMPSAVYRPGATPTA
jgi:hypothetical protein